MPGTESNAPQGSVAPDAQAPVGDEPFLRAENERLRKENEQLRKELKEKDAQIEELQRSVKRQAAPFSKGKPNPNPKQPGRKGGRRYGLKGHRKRPRRVDEVYEVPLPDRCPQCAGAHLKTEEVRSQFQEEIPRKPIIREFKIRFGQCLDCGRRVHGRHPLQTSDAVGAAESQLGPEAQALVVHLNKEGGLSYGKIASLFDAAFGISITRGGSAQTVLRAGHRVGPAYEQIRFHIQRSATVYADETGWKVAGRLWWLWAFVTTQATLYLIRPSRGHDVPEEVLGAEFSGNLGHDGWKPYDFFTRARHQQCLAHLVRRCVHLLDQATGAAVRFPRALKAVLQGGLGLRDRSGGLSPHGLQVAIGRLEARLDRLLRGRITHAANARLARHVRRHQDEIFTFLRHPEIEATDWMGEQAMRPAVVNRKVWGGNRTPLGAGAQEGLTSVLRTCRQQARETIDFLALTFRGLAPPIFST